MSVLIRKNYFKKWGAFIPWRRTIFVKHLRLVSVVNEHYDRNYTSPNNGFKFHARRGLMNLRAPCFRL